MFTHNNGHVPNYSIVCWSSFFGFPLSSGDIVLVNVCVCVCVCVRLCTCVCVFVYYVCMDCTQSFVELSTLINSVVYSRCFETCLVFLVYSSLPITGCLSNILEGSHTPADSIRLPFIIITNIARSQPSFSLSPLYLTHLVILWLARGLVLTWSSAPPQTNIWDTCSELVVLPLYWDSLSFVWKPSSFAYSM